MAKTAPKLLTTALKQYEVAVLAVYLLGGASRSVDTEDVAVKCHELAPEVFSWQKYKDQINLELVRVSLSDAKKRQKGALLSGAGREGWRLNSRGLDWIRTQEAARHGAQAWAGKRSYGKARSIESGRRARERLRLMSTPAWQMWKAGQAVTPRTAQQVFRIDEYTTSRMTAIKVARLRSLFDADDDLSRFLQVASGTIGR